MKYTLEEFDELSKEKPTLKITEFLDDLEIKHPLNQEEIKEVHEVLHQLENLDLFNDNTIQIILATPTSELMQKFHAILKWTETKPFLESGFKKPEELQDIYKTKIALECKNKCFELIWSHPDDVPSLSRGIAALYLLKTLHNNLIDTFQISYLTLLGKYPHGAWKIGNYLFKIGRLIKSPADNDELITVNQDYVDARMLTLEIALSQADEETRDGIFRCLSFHHNENTHHKINQNHLKYAKSLGATLRFLMEDAKKEPRARIFNNYDFRMMNNLVHQFPKHATILMEAIVAYMSLKKQAEETKDTRLDQMKMFFASLQEKLIRDSFNPKTENIEFLVDELNRFFIVEVTNLNETQKKSFSGILEEFQKVLKANRVYPLTALCISYIKANSFFNCQNPNQKLNLNQLPNELKQHFVPVTESKKTP